MSESRISTPLSSSRASRGESPGLTPISGFMERRARPPRLASGALDKPASPVREAVAREATPWDRLRTAVEMGGEPAGLWVGEAKGIALAVIRQPEDRFVIEVFFPAEVKRGEALAAGRIVSVQPFRHRGAQGTLCVVADPNPPLTVETGGADRPTVFWPVTPGPIHLNAAPPRLGHKTFDFLDRSGKPLVPVPFDAKLRLGPPPAPTRQVAPCCR